MSVDNRKHIIILTIPFFGHVIPAIGLARNLSRFAKVTFATLRGSLAHIRARGELTIQDQQIFDVLGIDDGLPVGLSEADYMKQIAAHLRNTFPHITKFVSAISRDSEGCTHLTDPVDAFIADIVLAKDLSQSSRQGIPYFIFSPGNVETLRSMLNVTERTPVCDASIPLQETFIMVWPESEGRSQIPVHPDYKKFILSVKEHLGTEKGILINSCLDIDQGGIQSMQKDQMTAHGRFYCIGPMIPCEKAEQEPEEQLLQELVTAWLDRKPPASVMYLSPGAFVLPTEEQLNEVTKALKILGKPFILSLPEILHKALPPEMRSVIASQFDGTDSHGLVLKWAPQKTILGHPAVQMFGSHCGWNSVIESIYFGKPVFGWPVFSTHLANALYLEKIGMGVSLVSVESAGLAGGTKKKVTAEDFIGAVRSIEDSSTLDGSGSITATAQLWSGKLKAAIAPNGSSNAELGRLVADCTREAPSSDAGS